MTVTAVDKDPAARTMTLTAEYAAPVGLVWQMVADPRMLERWWGPPGWPATFATDRFEVGERITYSMAGPDGETSLCWWRVTSIDPPRSLEADNGMADDDGSPSSAVPSMRMRFEVADLGSGRAQLRVITSFPTTEAMELVLSMGIEEGMTAAAGQIDALVAELVAART